MIVWQLAYMTTIYHYFCIKNKYFLNLFKSKYIPRNSPKLKKKLPPPLANPAYTHGSLLKSFNVKCKYSND